METLESTIRILGGGSSASTGNTTDSGCGSHSGIFGRLGEIDPFDSSISTIIVCVAVVSISKFFHLLHDLTYDSIFQELVVAIEHELMIVGCTAFGFKILINTSHFISPNWLLAIEYADILVPIVSIIFCFQGLLLLLLCLWQTALWSKGYHMLLEELLDEFYEQMKKHTFLSNWTRKYSIIAKMKFRIFHIIFSEQHKIVKNSLAFDEYVQHVYEKFLMDIVTIRPIDWGFLCLLILLNWARTSTKTDILYFKPCESHDLACENLNNTKGFICGGFAVLFVMFIIALVSRYYEYRVLSLRGIETTDDYAVFLKNGELANLDAANGHKKLRLATMIKEPIVSKRVHDTKTPKSPSAFTKDNLTSVWKLAVVKANNMVYRKHSQNRVHISTTTGEPIVIAKKDQDLVETDRGQLIALHFASKWRKSTTERKKNSMKLQASSMDSYNVSDMSESHKNRQIVDNIDKDNMMKVGLASNESSSSQLNTLSPYSDNIDTVHLSTSPSVQFTSEEIANSSLKLASSSSIPLLKDTPSISVGVSVGIGDMALTPATTATTISNNNSDIHMKDELGQQNGGLSEGTLIHSDSMGIVDSLEIMHLDTIPYTTKNDDIKDDISTGISTVDAVNVTGRRSIRKSSIKPAGHVTLGEVKTATFIEETTQHTLENAKSTTGELIRKLSKKRLSNYQEQLYQQNTDSVEMKMDNLELVEHSMEHTEYLSRSLRNMMTPVLVQDDDSDDDEKKNEHAHKYKINIHPITNEDDDDNEDNLDNRHSFNNGDNSDYGITENHSGKSIKSTKSVTNALSASIHSIKEFATSLGRIGSKYSNSVSGVFTTTSGKSGAGSIHQGGGGGGNQELTDLEKSDSTGRKVSKRMKYNINTKNTDDELSYRSPYMKKIEKHVEENPLGITEDEKERMKEFTEMEIQDLESIYFLRFPRLYFDSVKWMIFVLSLYLGLWLTNFLPVSLDFHHSTDYILLCLFPGIASMCLYNYIVRCAALLKAMTYCDVDSISEILEQTRASDSLATAMRDRILVKLQSMGKDPINELKNLFEELDSKRNNRINRKSWNQMFKKIDRDLDGQITLDDLFIFIFPDHNLSMIEENMRIRILQNRIRTNHKVYKQSLRSVRRKSRSRSNSFISKSFSRSRSDQHINAINRDITSSPSHDDETPSSTQDIIRSLSNDKSGTRTPTRHHSIAVGDHLVRKISGRFEKPVFHSATSMVGLYQRQGSDGTNQSHHTHVHAHGLPPSSHNHHTHH